MAKATPSEKKMNPKQEAKSAATAPERLNALAAEATDLACLVAANEACPSDLLSVLAEHKDAKVRQRVVSNPSTPAEVAARLGSQFPEQLLDNPAFEIYLLERPDLLAGIGSSALRSLVKRDICPAGFLGYAAGFDDQATQLAVLTNAAAPKAAVERLRKSAHPAVKEAAQWHVSLQPKLPKNWWESLSASIKKTLGEAEPNETLNALGYVIANIQVLKGNRTATPGVEADILEFKNPGEELRYLANNTSTPASTLQHLAGHKDWQVSWDVLNKNQATPLSAIERLLEVRDYDAIQNFLDERQQTLSSLDDLANSKDARLRFTVASSPLTPGSILEKLSAAKEPSVREVVAENPNTPSSILKTLSEDTNPAVRECVAKNSATPSMTLDRLSSDKSTKVLGAVASNPNTPASAFLRIISDLVSMDPNKASDIWCAIASNPSCPTFLLDQLAEYFSTTGRIDDEARLQSVLAQNPSTSEKLLEIFSKSKDLEIRVSACYNPSSPVSVLKYLALDKNPIIRRSVAANSRTPADVLDLLSRDKDGEVLKGVILNSTASIDLERIDVASLPSEIRGDLAKNPDSPLKIRKILALDKDWNIRHLLLRFDISNPSSLSEQFCSDQNEEVRSAVALSKATPSKYLIKLADDTEVKVRSSVASNNLTPTHVLAQLSEDGSIDVRRSVAGNPSTPVELLERLAADLDVIVRREVAQNKSVSASILELLALDSDQKVRSAVAYNISTPLSVLESFSDDPDLGVRCSLARNERVPAHVLEKLSRARDRKVRYSVAGHNATPSHVLEELTWDTDPDVRCEAANNRSTPSHVLGRLAVVSTQVSSELIERVAEFRASSDLGENLTTMRVELLSKLTSGTSPSASRLLGLRLPDCPSAALARAQRSSDWRERSVIASNPNTPPPVVERLASDGNVLVRAAALERLRALES